MRKAMGYVCYLDSYQGKFYVMRCEKQGTAMKIFMFVSAILVFASTVLIKQHVVIDIIGGVLVVEIGLFLAKKLNTKRIFYAIENKLGLE